MSEKVPVIYNSVLTLGTQFNKTKINNNRYLSSRTIADVICQLMFCYWGEMKHLLSFMEILQLFPSRPRQPRIFHRLQFTAIERASRGITWSTFFTWRELVHVGNFLLTNLTDFYFNTSNLSMNSICELKLPNKYNYSKKVWMITTR